ncbi:MAG TPA: SURF1 family protein [Nocardioidaceae bacterium]
MTFLFSRRWVLFAIAVALLALGCYRLGVWQFHRLAETKAENAMIERNLRAAPVPVNQVLAVGRPVAADEQWRRVRASGHYVEDETVVVRYQTRSGESGVDVVTPLRTDAGPAVLVDRGWMPTDNVGDALPKVPAPPQGTVTVVGWVRANATGDATTLTHRSTRAVSSAVIGPTLPFPVYGGFVDAQSETPRAAHPLVKAELPDLGNGPHFFYGIQWWFFAALAVFGFFYLAWDEYRRRRSGHRPGDERLHRETDPTTPEGDREDVRVEP